MHEIVFALAAQLFDEDTVPMKTSYFFDQEAS